MSEPLVTDGDREKVLLERTREWHEAGPDSPIAWRSLPEHLGMTIAEYNRWVEGA